ncbi:hypothetical protein GCM10011579_066330 [Streptomyces albiflavescens]|uniref:Uncharacterized protein n=1 Tax=Streptomyces albiflavescens TaxID=1623582 RepID=A0A917Y9D0_9ACTN|nr:hypothetical protein GCM10011579_066330 [Streptomyces albiflavescens]
MRRTPRFFVSRSALLESVDVSSDAPTRLNAVCGPASGGRFKASGLLRIALCGTAPGMVDDSFTTTPTDRCPFTPIESETHALPDHE